MLAELRKKLARQLNAGIVTEAQVVYLMVGIRKILEQMQTKGQYQDLLFHCNWAVHARLSGRAAQSVLKRFDAANMHLKGGIDLHELPDGLGSEIERISRLESLRTELGLFLKDNNLPLLDQFRPDAWVHFVHLYAQVVQDLPLEAVGRDSSSVSKVVVRLEMANRSVGDNVFFKVRWIVHDRNGRTGEIYVLNSFSLNPQRGPASAIKPP